jgi:uncharacterized protein YdhG (YjbR/CyaY superfamily)
MKSAADTVENYIEALPEDRRSAIETLRRLVLANLPEGYVEAFNWGMIAYEVPLEMSGKTYNGKPLLYAALASQKNHLALYLNCIYASPGSREKLEAAFRAAGKKFDMGKSCLRFKRLDDIELDAVAEAIRSVTPAELVAASKHKPPAKG